MKSLRFGTVRCFNTRSGHGWIMPDDGSHEISVQQAAVNDAGIGQLAAGQVVGFHVTDGHLRTAVDLWATWSNR